MLRSGEVHGLLALSFDDLALYNVLVEYLHAFFMELVGLWVGEDLFVIGFDVS